jgi:hypothetical protein
MYQMLPVFLDCPFWIARRFSPVSYVPDVAGASGLPVGFLLCLMCQMLPVFLDCPFLIVRRFSPVS